MGGNQSGQQSYFIGKGIERHQTEWNLDGVNVTEMQATGTSDFYYDFDSFQEMQVTTGGSDPRLRTPGVQINRFCASGLEAVNMAAAKVKSGEADFAERDEAARQGLAAQAEARREARNAAPALGL